MATGNAIYPLWKQSCMTEADTNKSLDQGGSNAVFAALLTIGGGGYTYSGSDQFYSSMVAFVQGTAQQITTPLVANGIFKGDQITFANVTGSTVGGIGIFRQNAGANSTWRLVAYFDTAIASFPITPAGATIVVLWSASGIFGL